MKKIYAVMSDTNEYNKDAIQQIASYADKEFADKHVHALILERTRIFNLIEVNKIYNVNSLNEEEKEHYRSQYDKTILNEHGYFQFRDYYVIELSVYESFEDFLSVS